MVVETLLHLAVLYATQQAQGVNSTIGSVGESQDLVNSTPQV